MDNTNLNYSQEQYGSVIISKSFISGVFTWMGLALTVTAIVAYFFAQDMQLMRLLFDNTGLTTFGYVVMFAPLGFVLLMSFGFQRLSATVMTLLFVIYAVLVGMSLSFIFWIYSMNSIFVTFAITAGMFGAMAIAGYTTKMDLTKFGSILMMAVVGIIIALVVNMFMKSSQLDYVISFIGVLVFTGLTAYDVQKLKRIGNGAYGAEDTRKLTILGALTLYLDFINLFLFLLRFFGRK